MDEFLTLERLKTLTTAHLADALVRMGRAVRCAPSNVRPLIPAMRCYGRCLPVRHAGSVDIFLEAIAGASVGDVLIVDNEGRLDEGCVGDLVALEAKQAGLSGIVIWGLNRDTAELLDIALPCFSIGTLPNGPLRARPRNQNASVTAMVGTCLVSADDVVMGDADGVLFLEQPDLHEVIAGAEKIRDAERQQAKAMMEGRSLRVQTRFDDYLEKSKSDSRYTFREHLRTVSAAIET
jgi:4-hydroxy-4-methyl-2-oxoglutarate aldolase